MDISKIKYLDLIRVKCVDSFSKIKMGSGHGESRLYLGSNTYDWGNFFENFNISCFFSKQDLTAYLEAAKFEYEEQTQPYLKDIRPLWQINMDKVQALQDYIFFNTEPANGEKDSHRYFIRFNANICTLSREIILPRMTTMQIQKIEYDGERFLWFRPYLSELGNPYENDAVAQFEKDIKANIELSETEKDLLIKARIGQGRFRDEVLKKYNEQCIITKINDARILIASHIKPWSVSNNNERLNCSNGLLLSPTFDKLFDKGFISFKNNGSIKLSYRFSEHNFSILGLEDNMKFPIKADAEMKMFLDYHRDVIFLKAKN